MSRTVDDRVVSMQFDNRQFESNVQTSLGTLEKLKQSLNLTGAAKGLEDIDRASKKVDMSVLGNAAHTVGLKFSAMYTMADQALRNITNRVQYTAENMIKAFTIDPVKTGLAEYETQIGAVQTILANTSSKGTTLGDVNGALDELNKYADQTIYNFTEMTRNIGTFTAAGVELDKSVTSIKGIANLAAVSGSTSQQASTAMYQLSQALAAGKVQLMDWNSVVNAGMGGQVFQDALKRTATQMGTNVDELIKKYGSFRESLTQGEWLTAEVLTETLTQLSGAYSEADLIAQGYTEDQAKEITKLAETAVSAATKVKTFTQLMDTLKEAAQSGWTQTWELLIGDFEEAKELWTGVSDAVGGFINATSERRNNLLGGALNNNWEKMVGMINEAGVETSVFEDKVKAAMDSAGYGTDKIISHYGSLEKAFKAGAINANLLETAIKDISKSASKVDLSSITKNLKKGMKGDDVKKAQEALQALGHDFSKYGIDGIFGSETEAAVRAFQELHGLEVTGIIDEKTLAAMEKAASSAVKLDDSIHGLIDGVTELGGREKIIESFKNIFEALKSVIKPISEAFREVFPPTTVEQLTSVIDRFHEFTSNLKLSGDQAAKIKSTFKGLFSIIDIGWTFIKKMAGGIVKLLGHLTGLGDGVLGITGFIGDWISKLRDSIKETDIFGTAIDGVVKVFGGIIDAIKNFFSFIGRKFKMPGFEGFFGLMKGIWDIVDDVVLSVAGIGSTIVDIFVNAFKTGNISSALDIINGGLLGGVLIGAKNFFKSLTDTTDGFGDIVENISGIFETLGGALETWQQNLKAEILLKIAGAIGILAASVLILSSIDPGALAGSLAAITVLFADLMGSMEVFNLMGGVVGGGATKAIGLMIGMSLAILILAVAMKKISDISWEGLAKGLVGVGALMAEIAMFLGFAKLDGKKTTRTALGIIALAVGIKILASACATFAGMSWGEIGKGLAAIGALLLEMAIFTKLTGNAKGVMSTGIALIFIGASMKIFASACKDFSGMSWKDIGKGLAGVAGSLLAVAIATQLMPRNMLGIGVGLTVVSGALLILTNALNKMGGMTWDEIGKGLATLGGSMLILAVAMNVMTGTLGGAAALIVVAGALAILTPVLTTLGSMTWGSIAKGLIAIAGAFAVIGVAGLLLGPLVPVILGLAGALALIGVAVLGAGVGLLALAAGITALGVAFAGGVTAIVAGISAIIVGIIGLIPAIAAKIGEAIVVFCGVIADSAGAIGEAVKAVVLTLVDVFVECVPEIADGLLKLISEVLASLAEYTPQIVDSLFDFLISLIDGCAERMPELIESAVNLVMQFFNGVVDAFTGFDASTILKGVLGMGIVAGLMLVFSLVAPLTAGALAGVLGVGAVIAELALVLTAIGALAQIPGLDWLVGEGGELIKNIGNAIGGFVGGIVGGIAEGITDALPDIGTNMSNFMTNLTPFIEGMKGIDDSLLTNAENLVGVIMAITGASLLESITSWLTGSSSMTTFGTELVAFGTAIKDFAAQVSGIDESAVTAAANAGTMLANMASAIPNSGGLVSLLTGDNSILTFSDDLIAFGAAMKSFSTEVSGIDETAVTAAASAGTMLSDLATNLPNSGGIVSWFTGDNSMETFGTELTSFGTAMKNFSDAVTGLDTEAVTAAATAGSSLSTMANSLPESGGLWSIFAGDNSMEGFGKDLVSFGKAMKSFSDEVSGIDTVAVSTASYAATALTTLANTLSTAGDNGDLSDVADGAKGLGSRLKGFYDEISDVDTGTLSSVVSEFSKLATIDLSGMGNIGTTLSTAGKTGVNSFIAAFTDASAKVEAAGKTLITNFVKGVNEQKDSPTKTFKAIVTACVVAIRLKREDFSKAGKYLVEGFVAGMDDYQYKAELKAKALAEAAKKAAENELGIASPSKVFYKIGSFTGQGFVNALSDYEDKTYKAGRGIAESARSGLANAISRVRDTIENGIDAQPTIRPVLDLSGVESGASAINGMFGTASVGTMAHVGAISTMMRNGQNGTNSDVISAINDLGKKLGNISSNTYQINGVTYDDGTNVSEAVKSLIRAARVERRV